MNESLDHDDPIEEVASDWLTQREEGFSLAQKREFERWCRTDPRHADAVARLEAACALLEKMPLVRAELQPVVEFPVKPRVIASAKKFPPPARRLRDGRSGGPRGFRLVAMGASATVRAGLRHVYRRL